MRKEEPVLKDQPIAYANVVFQGRWSLSTGSITLKHRLDLLPRVHVSGPSRQVVSHASGLSRQVSMQFISHFHVWTLTRKRDIN